MFSRVKSIIIGVLCCLALAGALLAIAAPGTAQAMGGYLADHRVAQEAVLRSIPTWAIEAAKAKLHILYCGTSHSQQVMEGMAGLKQYKTGDDALFDFTYDGNPVAGKLDIHYRGASGTDLSTDSVDGEGHTGYFNGTVAYLDSHPACNVVMWSWCSIEGHNVQIYLNNFAELIAMYAAGGSKGRDSANEVKFVFMTGYARGSDCDDPSAANSPFNNAQAIRDYARSHGHFCLDYWSQDVYNYGDGSFKPCESGNANVQHWQWETDAAHVEGTHWFPCRNWSSGSITYPTHCADDPTYAQHLTGNRRAYAAWWIWARLAGWNPGSKAMSLLLAQ